MDVLQMKECSRGCWRMEHVLCDTRRKGKEEEEECLPVKGQLLSPGCPHYNTATKEMTVHSTD